MTSLAAPDDAARVISISAVCGVTAYGARSGVANADDPLLKYATRLAVDSREIQPFPNDGHIPANRVSVPEECYSPTGCNPELGVCKVVLKLTKEPTLPNPTDPPTSGVNKVVGAGVMFMLDGN